MKLTYEQQLLQQSIDMLNSCKSYVNPILADRMDILIDEIGYHMWSLDYDDKVESFDPGQDYIP